MKMLNESEDFKDNIFEIDSNPNFGANQGFIMKSKNNQNQRFFVKTFSQSLEQEENPRLIDCRELLIYKLISLIS